MASRREPDEEDWIDHVREELYRCKSIQNFGTPSISMVSSPLRGVRHEAFIPQVVAIGPYHCDIGPHHSYFPDSPETQRYKIIAAKDMERHKIMVAKETGKRFKTQDFYTLVNQFLLLIEPVKAQYESEIDWKPDEKLALLLAMDASFVVEVLQSMVNMESGYASRFPLPLRKSIVQDFILLENQIPLFLLIKVLEMEETCSSETEAQKKLGVMVAKVASEVIPFYVSHVIMDLRERKHLLDCLYWIVTTPLSSEISEDETAMVERPTHSPRAVDLANAGVKFRPTIANVLDVSFNPRTSILLLPKIRVGDDTEKLFRNLIAYESHLIDKVEVLSYLRFMNNLIDTPEDVALLVGKGILAQDIGSNEEVAQMFNNLCVNTMRVWSHKCESVARALNKHCSSTFHPLKAEFKAQYLSRPWLVVSLVSGAAFFIMTFLVMLYTILLYHAGA